MFSVRILLVGISCFLLLANNVQVFAEDEDIDGDESTDEDSDKDEYGGGADGYGGEDGYGSDGPPGGGGAFLKTISSTDELKAFLLEKELEITVVGFFDETTNSADVSVFKEVANSESSYNFAIATAKEVLDELKYDGCAVIVYRPSKLVSDKYEKVKARYPSKVLKIESLEKFLSDKALPLVSIRSYKTTSIVEKTKAPLLTLFAEVDLAKNAKTFQYFANRLRKVASELKGKILFEIAGKSEYDYILSDYSLKLPGRNDVGVGIKHNDLYYTMTDAFTVENLKKFVDAYLAGQLEGKAKPASPSSEEDGDEISDADSKVVTLTDANFAQEVTESDKDVMVEFYAPWCGHCKQLKPLYAKLAEKLSDVPTVSIAAMDATAHTVPSTFKVEGYPTIFFVSAKDKSKPVPYTGERDVDSMYEFIKSHAKTPF